MVELWRCRWLGKSSYHPDHRSTCKFAARWCNCGSVAGLAKLVPSRWPLHILKPQIRIWRVNAAPHQHHTASINSGIMVLLAAAQTAIAKSRLLKARKIQQLQLEKRVSQAQAEAIWRGCPPPGGRRKLDTLLPSHWENSFR